MMKRLFQTSLLLLALLMPATASAYDLLVDNIYYDIESTYAVVTYRWLWESSYQGEITVPDSVTYKGTTYPVTEIGTHAFYNCVDMTSITLPNTLTTIGTGAFSGCSGLTSIDIPNSVTTIYAGGFSECSGLTSIFISKYLTRMYGNSFGYCTSLESIIVDSDNPRYDSRENCNGIIETSTNTLIAGCKNTNLNLLNPITAIGLGAFKGCSGLTSFNFPSSVTSLGRSAFGGSGLTSIVIPSTVTEIEFPIVDYCTDLESITVDSNHPYYDSRDNCNAVISKRTNTLLTACKNTVIPNSVTIIGDGAFKGVNMTSIDIPNSVTEIGEQAFYQCPELTSIDIPNSVTEIGREAFHECPKLTTAKLSNAITKISSSLFFNCTLLTNVEIPNHVTEIADNAFYNNLGRTSIVIPHSVTKVGGQAFYNCHHVTEVVIGKNVTRIISDGLSLGSSLVSVKCYAPTPPIINKSTFLWWETPKNTTLYIPTGTLSAYQESQYWNIFRYYVEFDPVLATSIQQNVTSAYIKQGETRQLTATVLPEETDDKTLNWTTSDPSVATVDFNGVVTAVGFGTATITATTDDGSDLSVSYSVTVYNESGDVNGDGSVNISDATQFISILLNDDSSQIELENGDLNGDGVVNISDVTMLISLLSFDI